MVGHRLQQCRTIRQTGINQAVGIRLAGGGMGLPNFVALSGIDKAGLEGDITN